MAAAKALASVDLPDAKYMDSYFDRYGGDFLTYFHTWWAANTNDDVHYRPSPLVIVP